MAIDARAMVQEFADECLQCGLCARTDCGNFGAYGGVNLGEVCQGILEGNEDMRHFPYTCALCNRCTVKCPAGLKAIDGMKPARALILQKHPELRPLYRHFRTDLKYNLFSLMQARETGDAHNITLVRGKPDLGGEADEVAFFPGCSLGSYAPALVERTFEWLREEGIASRMLTFCCGAPFFDTGFFDEFEAYRQKASSYIRELGIKKLVIACPHCGYELPQLLEGSGVELLRLPDLLKEKGMLTNEADKSITIHDACYDRTSGLFGSTVRDILASYDLKEEEFSHENTHCCGGGGMVSAYARDFCEYRRLQRLNECDATGADMVVSTCFSCVNSMQRSVDKMPVKHYLELVFGIDVDWSETYGKVDALYADPETDALLATEDELFA